MRLKHLKAQTAIPAAIISLIILLLVIYILFATSNRFTEHLVGVSERMSWFTDLLKTLIKAKEAFD